MFIFTENFASENARSAVKHSAAYKPMNGKGKEKREQNRLSAGLLGVE